MRKFPAVTGVCGVPPSSWWVRDGTCVTLGVTEICVVVCSA